MSNQRGEYIFLKLPDGTVCSLPAWMFDAGCLVRCRLGAPLIAIDALQNLRDLLSTLQPSKECGKDSSNPPFTEVSSEEANRTARVTTEPAHSSQSSGSNPENKQRELSLALVELLISGFRDSAPNLAPRGGDEPEVDR